MKNKLKDNLLIKIFSLAAAIILWFYIQMVQNPDVEYTFNSVKVNYVNAAVMEENKFVVLDDKEFTSNITVKCQRWTLNELDSEDFVVYVDLSDVKQAGANELPVKVRLNNENIIVTNKSPSNITVQIDKVITVEKPLQIHLSGKLKEGYYTSDKLITSDSNVVTLSGPKTLVDKVSGGVVSVDLNNKSADFTDVYNIILVDSNGTAISSNNITLLNETAMVSATIYVKKIVPIELLNMNPDLQYEIKPSSVEIAGTADTINAISKLSVSDFVLENAAVGYSQDIRITLPKNVIMLTDITPQIEVMGFNNKEE